MTSLLTREEYEAIARTLVLPTNAFIDGGFRPAKSGNTIVTLNPANGVKLADIAACDAEDVDFAVQKAREAFDDGRWSKMHPGGAQGYPDPPVRAHDPPPP